MTEARPGAAPSGESAPKPAPRPAPKPSPRPTPKPTPAVPAALAAPAAPAAPHPVPLLKGEGAVAAPAAGVAAPAAAAAAPRPKIRPLEAVPTARGRRFRIFDPRGLSDRTMEVSPDVLFAVLHFDGTRTVADVAELYQQRFHRPLKPEEMQEINSALEECFFFDGPAFQEHVRQLVAQYRSPGLRRAAHAGSAYAADGRELEREIRAFFAEGEGAPGLPDPAQAAAAARSPLKALVAPHIDLHRGGRTYAHAYKVLAETAPRPDLFVLLGTAHAGSGAPYTATGLDFETPLGVAPVARDFLERLAGRYGKERLYEDELTHASEHSLEFQVLFLKWLFREEQPFRIVPLLCGSFAPLYEAGTTPGQAEGWREFVPALKATLAEEAASGRKVCLVAAADLSHIGARFGHADPITPRLEQKMERADRKMLELVTRRDAEGFFRFIQAEDDRRNICGAAPIWTVLSAAGAGSCELLHYAQAVERDDEGPSAVVTFAALALR